MYGVLHVQTDATCIAQLEANTVLVQKVYYIVGPGLQIILDPLDDWIPL